VIMAVANRRNQIIVVATMLTGGLALLRATGAYIWETIQAICLSNEIVMVNWLYLYRPRSTQATCCLRQGM